MEKDINVDNSASLLYDQYLSPEFELPAQQVITGTAITNINGLTGPNVTISGGTSGLTVTPAGVTITIGTPMTTKGDLFTRDVSGGIRLGVGSNDQVLTADSSAASGLKWAAGVSTGSQISILSTTTLNLNTNTKQTLYTVPAGKSAIVTMVVGRSPSVDLSGGATGRVDFGFNAGATDWSAPGRLDPTVLTASNLFATLSQDVVTGSTASVIGSATNVFGAICDVAFGSAATVVINVIGYEF